MTTSSTYSRVLVFILFFVPISIFAQRIDNVQTTQDGKTIVVTYDLKDLTGGLKAIVNLYCSEDAGTTWSKALLKVSGDVGTGITAGSNKRIAWDVLAERERFVGERMVFEVRASIILPRQPFEPEIVFIQGGSFLMGSNDGFDDEKPVHRVTLSDYYMGKYEVTQAQWQALMGSNPSYFKGDNLPVEQVSWNDVQEYIHILNKRTRKNYRLPTEAEWEFACRAGTFTQFNTGDCLSTSQANYNGNFPYTGCSKGEYRQKNTPVGTFAPNAWGLYDMHGNVWEWCSDWYGSYISAAQNSPQGPGTGATRVVRGGSWFSGVVNCRSADRSNCVSNSRDKGLGFRLVVPK